MKHILKVNLQFLPLKLGFINWPLCNFQEGCGRTSEFTLRPEEVEEDRSKESFKGNRQGRRVFKLFAAKFNIQSFNPLFFVV